SPGRRCASAPPPSPPAMLPAEPDLRGVAAALGVQAVAYVVIGGFAVIANRHVRATEDVDVLVPEEPENDRRLAMALRTIGWTGTAGELAGRPHVRAQTDAGQVDVVREGEPPLDFRSVAAGAIRVEYEGVEVPLAGLASLVAFKRLAGRLRDRADLEALAEIHGELPLLQVPGLDEPA
ncbi:MAG TPA: hypothetical protein VGR10_04645, partial [Thermoleophilaceae bacterium]|nr:hypothetical protein [Thermoleophilaceae bacterium]